MAGSHTLWVGTAATRCRRKPAVLHGHVYEQIAKIPAQARSRPPEIGLGDNRDDPHRGLDSGAVVGAYKEHGLTMWGYSVLVALDRSPMRTQDALAEAIKRGQDPHHPNLDELQSRGYIERHPAPDDRRVRLLAITEDGRAVKDAAQDDIQRGENRWLSKLSAADRTTFVPLLQQLTDGQN